jgi:GNAT superfamily N-acetyltransferase
VNVGSRLRAQLGNADDVYELLLEASAWLKRKGIRQWDPPYPRARFVREIEEGHVWYWAFSDEALGTVTLLEHRPEYYPPGVWDDAVSAWYVCRFTVSRKLVGQRVGEQLLSGLEADARARGIAALRLDVSSSNPFLERYYVERGFELRQTGEIFGARSAFLEKRLA